MAQLLLLALVVGLVPLTLDLVSESLDVEVGHSLWFDDVSRAYPIFLLRHVEQVHCSPIHRRLLRLLPHKLFLAHFKDFVFGLDPVTGLNRWALIYLFL